MKTFALTRLSVRAVFTIPFLLSVTLFNSVNSFARENDSAALENTSWQLVEIRDLNNSVFTPDRPENYLLRFRLEGRLQIEADCNQAGATWTLQDDSLSFSELVSTRKFCPSPSLFNRYLMHLDNVQTFSLQGEKLILGTGAGGAELEFEPYVFVVQSGWLRSPVAPVAISLTE